MESIASIIGAGAEELQDSITRKFTDFRLGKGIRGDADIFKRWGITPEKVRAFEQSQGGRRMDVLQWMRQFVGTREKLQAQLKALPEGSPQRKRIERIIGMMGDDTLKLFNKSFSDKAMTMTIKDLDRIERIQDDATALGNVKNAERAGIEFDITLKGLKRTFSELTQGIGGDIQPIATKVMEDLRKKLIDLDRGGQRLGRALRGLGAELATKALADARRDHQADRCCDGARLDQGGEGLESEGDRRSNHPHRPLDLLDHPQRLEYGGRDGRRSRQGGEAFQLVHEPIRQAENRRGENEGKPEDRA